MLGVVEIGGDEDVELVVTEGFKRADIGVAQRTRNLDGVALESAK